MESVSTHEIFSVYLPPDAKSLLIRKEVDVGKDWGQEEKWGNRKWGGWVASPMQWAWVKDKEAWHAAVQGVAKSWTWLSDWKTTDFLGIQKELKQFYSPLK